MARRPRKRVAKRRVGTPQRQSARRTSRVSPPPKRLHNLPTQLTTFIGREREITEVKDLLGGTRLLTLTGSGGCGKTRLALQVAAGLLGQYPDGVWFVDLAPVADPAFAPNSVAAALDVPEQPTRPLTDTLADYLRARNLLLVLDNCEHLRTACQGLVDRLLRTSATIRILSTSREALGVEGESTYRVPPLGMPDVGQVPPLAHLAEYDAIRLFTERAALAQPRFAITTVNAPAVLQVCQRLDGMPLAIEFAAARVGTLSVEQIGARLDDRFRLLTAGSKKTIPRHQTLRAALDWSHDLLAKDEQTLFRRLSVFAGGFTLEMAQKVCAAGTLDESDILDLLFRLVDKSLVVFDETSERYGLAETIREYGRGSLAESEMETQRGRHLSFFLDFAETAETGLEGAEQEKWLNRVAAEHDNLREALAWSMRSAPEKALRLAGALGRFWLVRTHWTEGRAWLEKALRGGTRGSAGSRVKALNWAGWMAVRQLDYVAACEHHEKGLAINQELGNRQGIADSTYYLGVVAMNEADHARASALLQQSLTMYRQLACEPGILNALADLGHERWHQGDLASARALLEEAVALARTRVDKRVPAFVLWSLGLVAFDLHNYADASSLYKEGLVTTKELGDANFSTYLVEAFASLFAATGEHVQAARLLGAAQAHRKARGIPLALAHRSDYVRPLATIRAGLNEDVFAAAWAEGSSMSLEQAIEHALAASERRAPTAVEAPAHWGHGDNLTPRQREVARLVAQGRTNREIASRLNITERTAETHVRNILNKVNVSSRTQIAVWALAHGLPSPAVDQ